MSVQAASLESILSAVKAKSPTAQADELLAFTRAFYAQVPEEELALRSAEVWAAIALSNR